VRLTVTVDEARGSLRVDAEHALRYPPGQVCHAVAAAARRALAHPAACQRGRIETRPPDQACDPATAAHQDLASARGRPRAELVRGRVLRMLDRGATVAEAADRFDLDPEQIDRWDDAATDGRTDLIAAGPALRRWSQ
jgi:hypothetical protein